MKYIWVSQVPIYAGVFHMKYAIVGHSFPFFLTDQDLPVRHDTLTWDMGTWLTHMKYIWDGVFHVYFFSHVFFLGVGVKKTDNGVFHMKYAIVGHTFTFFDRPQSTYETRHTHARYGKMTHSHAIRNRWALCHCFFDRPKSTYETRHTHARYGIWPTHMQYAIVGHSVTVFLTVQDLPMRHDSLMRDTEYDSRICNTPWCCSVSSCG